MYKVVRCSKVLFFCLLFSFVMMAYASGSIDETDKYSWSSNAGWCNFHPQHGDVMLVRAGLDYFLKGSFWAENIGWIKLGAAEGAGPYLNSTNLDWGVNIDAAGTASGYAWSSHVGWICFNPTHEGVFMDTSTGVFSGYAWSENLGWIHFRNAAPQYQVRAVLPASIDDWMLQ